MAVAFQKHSEVGRSGWATLLSRPVHLLFPTQARLVAAGGKQGENCDQLSHFVALVALLRLWCCSFPLGRLLLLLHVVLGVEVPNPGFSAFLRTSH